jgi:hypothetical protein
MRRFFLFYLDKKKLKEISTYRSVIHHSACRNESCIR